MRDGLGLGAHDQLGLGACDGLRLGARDGLGLRVRDGLGLGAHDRSRRTTPLLFLGWPREWCWGCMRGWMTVCSTMEK